MSRAASDGVSRRDMLKTTGGLAASAAQAHFVLPGAYAAEDNTIQLAIVGCGAAYRRWRAPFPPAGSSKLVACRRAAG